MATIFEQVLMLFLFAATGFTLAKLGVVKKEHAKVLSQLLVYVFLPCSVMKTYTGNFTVSYIKENASMLLVSSIVIIIIAILAHFGAKLFAEKGYTRKVYEYALAIPNLGYMGYPMAERLMGSAGMMNAMVFALPISMLYINSIGFCNLTKRKFTLKNLINPAFVPVVIGAILGLSQLKLPNVFYSVFNTGNSCMGPTSMLMAGIVVSEFNIKPLLTNVRAYIVVALRLVIIPIVVGLSLSWLPNPEIAKIAVLLYAMPCGLNTIVFPKLVDENCELGASFPFLSNILACITIPVVLSLFGI